MSNSGHETMADKKRAERIKKAILKHGTYEEFAEKTGISISTLVRITSAKTEPKFTDVMKIAEVSGTDLYYIAYDDPEQVQRDNTEERLIVSADGYSDRETTNAHYFIIWNLKLLDKQDILAIQRQVSALSSYSYNSRLRRAEMDQDTLISLAASHGNQHLYEKMLKEQKDIHGKSQKEIEELRDKYPLNRE